MFANVVVTGGSAGFPGIAERLANELRHLAPADTKVRVTAPPWGRYFAWIGGSIMASMGQLSDSTTNAAGWVTKALYDEEGPSAVHRICF